MSENMQDRIKRLMDENAGTLEQLRGHDDDSYPSCCERLAAAEAERDRLADALTETLGTITRARRSTIGPAQVYSPQIDVRAVERWRSALPVMPSTLHPWSVSARERGSDG